MSLKKLFPLASLALLVACNGPAGPHVRVATATKADLEAVADADTVWYEFQPGDVVPIQFMNIGVAEGGSEPRPLVARETFYLVMQKNRPMQISFDGKTFATADRAQLLVAIIPGDDDRARVVWISYVGKGQADDELARILNEPAPSEPSTAPAASAESAAK